MTRIGFAVTPDGVTHVLDLSEKLSNAYDVLAAEGLASEELVNLIALAERDGKDPVVWAKHFVKVRREFNHMRSDGSNT